MSEIKLAFSIGELENLTGIKAATIRIWEKRYGLLTPARKDSNLRLYSTLELQKLLNIAVLIQHGYKISKIAQFSDSELVALVASLELDVHNHNQVLQQFKRAMMTYDEALFFSTYEKVSWSNSFTVVFQRYFIVLLEQIGVLWHTQQILPSHEHFVSNLIRTILIQHTYRLPVTSDSQSTVFVLFTPLGEIHELALLYLQYEIKQRGLRCIYLGANVPIDTLYSIKKQYQNSVFLMYNTVLAPVKALEYLSELAQIVSSAANGIWFAGKMDLSLLQSHTSDQLLYFNSMESIMNQLDKEANL